MALLNSALTIRPKEELGCPQNKDEEAVEYMVPKGKLLAVQEGDFIRKGDMIIDGSPVPHDILNILGIEALADYLVKEVQMYIGSRS